MVRCLVFTLFGILLHGGQVNAQERAEEDPTRPAVEKALLFLSRLQEKDGSWWAEGEGHPGVTSLAILAFLSAGHVPGEGPYGEAIDKAIGWVVRTQDDRGIFSPGHPGGMYNQGICTLMLAEVAGMTGKEQGTLVRDAVGRGVEVILRAQRTSEGWHKGGWRYSFSGEDGADLSVTGWQLMALRAARNIGCDVPGERIELAIAYVRSCRDHVSGGFFYQPGHKLTPACTGTGLLALELSGKKWHKSHETLRAGSSLLRQGPTWGSEHCLYGLYYAAQGMFQLGDNYWLAFRPRLHRMLLDNQEGNGCWLGSEGSKFSPVYATALGVLALTVENRFLPIYQRNEEVDLVDQ